MNQNKILLGSNDQKDLLMYKENAVNLSDLLHIGRGRIIKSIYNLVSHCLPCNSSYNVINHSIGIMEAFSNVNIVAKLLAKLEEVESSCNTITIINKNLNKYTKNPLSFCTLPLISICTSSYFSQKNQTLLII